ncbi:MAG: transposase [Candidatus Hodarchaeota archaeon]
MRKTKRVLATDIGLINLTTSVICEAGSQMSQPIFWSPPNTLVRKIERLYGHIKRLQKKVAQYPAQWFGQGRRVQERDRLYSKLNRYREHILHVTSNHLLDTAVRWGCHTIVLEDLRTYVPPKQKQKLSRKLSNW